MESVVLQHYFDQLTAKLTESLQSVCSQAMQCCSPAFFVYRSSLLWCLYVTPVMLISALVYNPAPRADLRKLPPNTSFIHFFQWWTQRLRTQNFQCCCSKYATPSLPYGYFSDTGQDELLATSHWGISWRRDQWWHILSSTADWSVSWHLSFGTEHDGISFVLAWDAKQGLFLGLKLKKKIK